MILRMILAVVFALGFVPFNLDSGFKTDIFQADVDDFDVESFEAEYHLGRDAEGRSTLETTERITIIFPDFDQNRGFIRDIPRDYDGHSTNIEVLSVTDEKGSPRPFSLENYGDFRSIVMAVPEGQFVHGRQTYILKYTQQNVTKYFEDVAADEFYWDVNGTDWSQPFGRIKATLFVDQELASAFNGNVACYRGVYGSDTPCEITINGTDAQADEYNFAPYENMTIAMGFEAGTFYTPEPPLFKQIPVLFYGAWLALGGAILAATAGVVRNFSAKKSGNPIIAQYDPPSNTSVALAAEIIGALPKAPTATLLDFAVRGKARLIYDENADVYGVQILDTEGLSDTEQKFANAIHKAGAEVYWLDRKSTALGDAAKVLTTDAKKDAAKYGLRGKRKPLFGIISVILLGLTITLLAVHVVIIGQPGLLGLVLGLGVNVFIWASLGIIALTSLRKPFTAAGVQMREHLLGLHEYIRLAEAERLRMLQSVSGAEVDRERVVQVYERLLPYAVLFGQEKEWQSELAKYYVQSSPDWYAGSPASFSHGLSLAALHSTVKSSPTTQPTYSGSGSSFSSSGGSFGGGFSGGGGGGGGGRGI